MDYLLNMNIVQDTMPALSFPVPVCGIRVFVNLMKLMQERPKMVLFASR